MYMTFGGEEESVAMTGPFERKCADWWDASSSGVSAKTARCPYHHPEPVSSSIKMGIGIMVFTVLP